MPLQASAKPSPPLALRGLLLAIVLAPFSLSAALAAEARIDDAPKIEREFRAVWIATVANIDWPSKPGLSAEAQRAELTALLDQVAELGMNAVVLQVRPACDALYASELEPWSSFLSGTQGVAPDDGYDPLAWACDAAHRRGLELHAWLNPYRATHPAYSGELAETHISKRRPDLVRQYGVYGWVDPGEPEATEHSLAVVRDIVRRYDVDAIHYDDYFYPYPVSDALAGDPSGKKVETPFPDDASWEKYRADTPESERLVRDDWRRENVNGFIRRCGQIIHEEKPHVRFGVSPFGIWRPGTPEGIQGFDQYAKLYADARLWLREGWVDYLAPQLYWPIEQKPQSFTTLLNWWVTQNPQERGVWPGLYTSKVSFNPPTYSLEEIPNQIAVARGLGERANGHIHFSMKAIAANAAGIADRLKLEYATPAIPPAAPWLAGDQPRPGTPSVTPTGLAPNRFKLAPGEGPAPKWWLVQKRCGEQWITKLRPYRGPNVIAVLGPSDEGAPATAAVVTAIDAFGRASDPVQVTIAPPAAD
ncbi:glycoside hydrolase family 10 protein [Botrimarina hoheduenensis]|uniref:Glycosyl hydrolase-like 10 domain-containing protein n=1 Tax=Botrimarina hoheduenensis TaxID=2528000 RepID=A0A5C5VSE0_9BACT|nr:family 10 glycosylhydrolase [Botrimarina hoheduenensis]TWT40815.1 hypothetical protein Pla111_32330 [Botrimarina hoheduenensis]